MKQIYIFTLTVLSAWAATSADDSGRFQRPRAPIDELGQD